MSNLAIFFSRFTIITMNKIEQDKNYVRFFCPGCRDTHLIDDTKWEFNNDLEKPTIKPSILVDGHGTNGRHGEYVLTPRCHSFVTDGEIQFLEDSQHPLAGQTVALPDWHREDY